ncbi:MAG: hypothetical protein ABIS06_11400 [Vicinamibacterales bacterium]
MDADSTVRRVERTACYVCGIMTLVALLAARGDPWPAVAVLGGVALIAFAYRSLKAGVAGVLLSAGGTPVGRSGRARAVFRIASRYALLGFLAYVMIARLRLHPLGLLAGASSFVAAVSIETLRLLIRKH